MKITSPDSHPSLPSFLTGSYYRIHCVDSKLTEISCLCLGSSGVKGLHKTQGRSLLCGDFGVRETGMDSRFHQNVPELRILAYATRKTENVGQAIVLLEGFISCVWVVGEGCTVRGNLWE